MSDYFDAKCTVTLNAKEVLPQIPKRDVIVHCVLRYPVEMLDAVIECANEYETFGRDNARELLKRLDALRAALAHAAEHGDAE